MEKTDKREVIAINQDEIVTVHGVRNFAIKPTLRSRFVRFSMFLAYGMPGILAAVYFIPTEFVWVTYIVGIILSVTAWKVAHYAEQIYLRSLYLIVMEGFLQYLIQKDEGFEEWFKAEAKKANDFILQGKDVPEA